ncbi:hypothetical protein GWI33_013080, partial [Rhynchophorus ferrugineus]
MASSFSAGSRNSRSACMKSHGNKKKNWRFLWGDDGAKTLVGLGQRLKYADLGRELTLSQTIAQVLSHSNQGQPILLNVTAEEVRSNPQEGPAQSTTVQLALIPPGVTSGSPTFGAIEYHALLDENSPVGTELDLTQAEITTEPGDVVTLELQKNNGTFDISPSVVEGFSRFRITVHDNRLLDYEARHYVECFIVAKEIGKGNYTARAKLTVVLNDVNDNPPKFVKTEFRGTVQ